ncbi:MAG: phage baseplate assembly protein V [Acidobacteriia bacterium]|nr:phage baseplate assembly protein V [Terriglobia bacterium]
MQGCLEFEEIVESRTQKGFGGRFYGAYPGLVRDLRDPDNQGRVRVALPWSPDGAGGSYETWARVSTMMAGNNQGSWFIPDTNVEVLVIFLGGDPRHPCVIGAFWNGQDSPPQSMDGSGNNNIKKLRSRNGVAITLDDTQGTESLTLETPGGQKITMKDGPGSIQIQDSNGNSLTLDTSGVTINAAAKVTVSCSQAEVTAGMVSVNAGMSKFSGVVNADTVITNSVVSASYTPGAGNIW